MKTAIYIEDGATQLVLTPENEWEKSVISKVELGTQHVRLHKGGFYACQGGWVRQSANDDSLIIRASLTNPE